MDPDTIAADLPGIEQIRQQVVDSHRRSRAFGISPTSRNQHQLKLAPPELEARKEECQDLLEVITAHFQEFYELLSPEEFMVAFADGEGYILHQEGSDEIKMICAERNCSPGYRWTEEDVGTTAISLCLRMQSSLQLNDKDHFCKKAHGFTSSAAPIFGHQGVLEGVLVVSGESAKTHPHTLIMITMMARSIEKHMRLLRRNREMSLYIGFLDNVIEATGTGLMTLDRELQIRKVNRQGKEILRNQDLEGRPVSVLNDLDLDLQEMQDNPQAWKNREADLANDIHVYYTAQPVVSPRDETLLGAVMVFEELNSIRKLADKISGAEPFFTFERLIGSSEVFAEAVQLAKLASRSSSTVLLRGETGTGKELFAQAIHKGGRRAQQAFVPINCGAIPGELLESELFGYVDGAFTGASRSGRPGKFELADGGTILLDEIGDMPHDMQVKLLRVLQTGEVQRIGARKLIRTDARIIAATHVDLAERIELKRFRNDLYYRLNIIQINLPTLSQRGAADIEALAHHFINRYGSGSRLSGPALDTLVEYDWPGNVRELENTIQRALHLCGGRVIGSHHLGLEPRTRPVRSVVPGTLKEMEKNAIAQALEENQHNMARTAKGLGISRATLYRKVKAYRITAVRSS
ncbi:sigma-54-dependent Fis family transcriptional regulator [Desulfogranum mediterraneum]|uniref:sigma-54-dependent Fis family transcriptional regulator n=1 Tax=Desulfogranum mediterraneum TaxID=160661 RepID=UPI0004157556|nr:sigma-54-dependent Fis family transcriptional regulator [Desulfogranum mediterraneum]